METEVNKAHEMTVRVVQADIEKRIHGKIKRMGLSPERIDVVPKGNWLDVHLDGVARFAVRMKVNNLGERKYKFKDYGTTTKRP